MWNVVGAWYPAIYDWIEPVPVPTFVAPLVYASVDVPPVRIATEDKPSPPLAASEPEVETPIPAGA